jgi:hypothetical protein
MRRKENPEWERGDPREGVVLGTNKRNSDPGLRAQGVRPLIQPRQPLLSGADRWKEGPVRPSKDCNYTQLPFKPKRPARHSFFIWHQGHLLSLQLNSPVPHPPFVIHLADIQGLRVSSFHFCARGLHGQCAARGRGGSGGVLKELIQEAGVPWSERT